MNVTDGHRVYEFAWLLSPGIEMYAHEGGVFYLWSPAKESSVGIDPIGMTRKELLRAISAGDAMLANAEPAPVNRKQRRARPKAVN